MKLRFLLTFLVDGNNTVPNTQTAATNATFAAEVEAQYSQNRTGEQFTPLDFTGITKRGVLALLDPLTVGYGNSVVFLPLETIDPNYERLIAKLATQNSSAYLPSEYETALLQGYEAQKKLLLASYASRSSAILKVFFNGDPITSMVLQKPVSRGTVHLNLIDQFADPIIDPRVFNNPVDMEIDVAMVKFTRKWFLTPTHAKLNPIEIIPGAGVTSDAGIVEVIRQYSTPSIGHALGTCAMMPLNLGGVVDSELLVYGVKGLSIVDASTWPLAPATHMDATVYAVAEKVCDTINYFILTG